mgnify:FL=1
MPYLGKEPRSPEFSTSAKTSAYTVVAVDDASTILCSAASADYAVALTAAATLGDGFTVTLKKSDATKFMITINPNSTETIDGLPDLKLRQEHASVTLICDGSNWHIVDHSNVEVPTNIAENSGFNVDQYGHITRTGVGDATELLQDRWRITPAGSASARWTYSQENNGGINGDSQWGKLLNTTADASPGSAEGQGFGQSVIGNTSIQLLGTDNKFENAVLSMDIIVHKGGSSSISLPAKIPLYFATIDGTQYQYAEDVSLAAVDTWYRVSASANLVPGIQRSCIFGIGLYGGSGVQETSGTWATGYEPYATGTSSNLADATGNYVGIANVVFQPGQIASPYQVRSYSEELARCRYFYERLIPNTASNQSIFQAYNVTSTVASGIFNYAHKRAAPTLTFTAGSTFEVRHQTTTTVCTAAAVSGSSDEDRCLCNFTVSSGLTGGQGCIIRRNDSDTTYVEVSAEL